MTADPPALYAERVADGATAFYFDREGWEWAFTDRRDWRLGEVIPTQRGQRRIAAVQRPEPVLLSDRTCTYEGSALDIEADAIGRAA